MRIKKDRGAVLVTSLLVLALLSLMGAGALLSATLDTRSVTNQRASRQSFYAAEAALDVAVGDILAEFRAGKIYEVDGATVAITAPVTGSDFNGYTITYQVDLPPNSEDPTATTPQPIVYSTTENQRPITNISYQYLITGRAVSNTGTDREEIVETIKILERPVTQYLAFYEGDMNWRPQQSSLLSVEGGRVHANGDIYMAPRAGIEFTYDPTFDSNAITATGDILYHQVHYTNGTSGGAGAGNVIIAVPDAGGTTSTDVNLTEDILPETRAKVEDLFAFGLDSILRTGVDTLTTIDRSAIQSGGRYESYSLHQGTLPFEEDVDTLHITNDGGAISIKCSIDGGAPVDVTNDIRNPTDFTGWSSAVRINPDGNTSTFVQGSIVYSVEDKPAANPATVDQDYPTILETNDPREGTQVNFTVIDLQRLSHWYMNYYNAETGSFPSGDRGLLIYAERSRGVGGLEAIKLIGSFKGRERNPAIEPSYASVTGSLVVPTTFVTPNPVYIDGELNVTSLPFAIISDAITVLSNDWGEKHYGVVAGITSVDNATTYNAAFITGRESTTGGGGGVAEGVEDLLRKVENWGFKTLETNGAFISPWFSGQATGAYNSGLTSPPLYSIGWDPALRDVMYTNPPYIPKIYGVEREAWQEE
ncbi:MAG: hypothetical protein C0608_09025 [Deltaproteobacteria bacterium]|nr:MAG: hypothetical protein C0608_09025 [Deltaproteobacteria bacterium]